MSSDCTPSSTTTHSGNCPPLLRLPQEILQLLASFLYDPLRITQEERLSWNIFSSLCDNLPERTFELCDLISFGVCNKTTWEAVRPSLYRCIRISELEQLERIRHQDAAEWRPFVKSLIFDCGIFEEEIQLQAIQNGTVVKRRCPFREAATLRNLVAELPALQHISFFADSSDDLTLSLFFADTSTRQFFASTLRSLGWRARSATPKETRDFNDTSPFVAFEALIPCCTQLQCLVLDYRSEEKPLLKVDVQGMVEVLSHDEHMEASIPQERQMSGTAFSNGPTANTDFGPGSGRDGFCLMICGILSGWIPDKASKYQVESHPISRPPVFNSFSDLPSSIQTRRPFQHYPDNVEFESRLAEVYEVGFHSPLGDPVVDQTITVFMENSLKIESPSTLVFRDLDLWNGTDKTDVRAFAPGQSPLTEVMQRQWLQCLAGSGKPITELFLDQTTKPDPYTPDRRGLLLEMKTALLPLINLPQLRILQVGGYPLRYEEHMEMTQYVLRLCPRILVCGWWSLEERAVWYSVWRDRHTDGPVNRRLRHSQCLSNQPRTSLENQGYHVKRYLIKTLGCGELFHLEAEQSAYERLMTHHESPSV